MGGGGGGDDPLSSLFGGMGGGMSGGQRSFRGMGSRSMGPMHGMHGMGSPMKDRTIERKLRCTLEELYTGTTRKMKISRKLLNGATAEEIIEIVVKKGWKAGTKITFTEKGDEKPDMIPADITFIIEEAPHSRFTRRDNDLLHVARVSLRDALCGVNLSLKHLDDRTLDIKVSDVINPHTTKVLRGEGMSITKTGGKGDLIIKFEIVFPTRLSDQQKQQLASALP